MLNLLRTAFAAVAISITLPAAWAADMPVKAPPPAPAAVAGYSWTGFYLGGHGGWAWTDKDWADPTTGLALVSFNADSGFGGVQGGFNWQTGPWVLGAEAQASWTHLRKGIIAILIGIAPPPFFIDPITNLAVDTRLGATIDQFGSVAGRIGYAWGPWLAYARGGAAWVDDTFRVVHLIGGADVLVASTNETRWGWLVGGGIEYGLTANWSVKAEFDYMDFGTEHVGFARLDGGLPAAFPLDIKQTMAVAKLGINYRFGLP